MITDIRYDGFIGIFDTEYDTQPLIDYWEYQNNVGATFKRKGLFGRERKAHARKDTCLATEDFMLDHNCGYQWMRQYNEVTGRCLEEYIDNLNIFYTLQISTSISKCTKDFTTTRISCMAFRGWFSRM